MTTQLSERHAPAPGAARVEGSPPPAPRHSERRLHQSLRGKILVRALVIALVPLLLIGFITVGSLLGLSQNADQTLDSERTKLGNEVSGQRLRTEARTIALELDGFLHERVSDVTGWAANPTVTQAAIAAARRSQPYAAAPNDELEERFADSNAIGSSSAVGGFLDHQLEREQAFSSIFFTERNGYNVVGTSSVDDFVQRDEEWWLSTQIRGLHFGAIEFDADNDVYSLPLSARVKNPKTGEGFGGVLQARLGVDLLQQVAQRNAGLEGRQVTILNADGLLLAETGSERADERIMRRGVTFSAEKQEAINTALAAGEPGFLVQQDTVVGYTPLSSVRDRASGTATDINAFRGIDANPINWVVLVEQPTDAAFAQLQGLEAVRQGLTSTSVQLAALGAVALVLAVIAASIVSSRLSGSIVQPLLSLRRAAYDISERQLPELVDHVQRAESDDDLPTVPAVEVKTDDEVEDVADAFNVVRDTAVDLAAEQARSRRNLSTMYVNLGRRNQGLLRKQLEFIDELERDESDTRLREILFRLDHLATRMRRNAESLLVLAGEESPRIWTQPIPLSDVVRGAIAEVEEYERIDVRDVEDISVVGKSASDLSHLLAELIDNATTFSPPDSLVTVIGWRVADGYALSIVDDGIGMTDDELRQANERLRSAPALHRVPSSHLGLFVVGGLAGRYGITVRLGESTGEGVVAKVMLPRELLVERTQPPPPPVHAGAGASQYRQPTGDSRPSEYESALSWEGDGGTHEQPAPEPVRLGRTADNDTTADWVVRRGDTGQWPAASEQEPDDAPADAELQARKARERLGGYQRAVQDGRAAVSSQRGDEPRDTR